MPDNRQLVSIIIPNWNGEQLLKTNLKNLLPRFEKNEKIKEVIVSDDASTDESVQVLKKLKKEFNKMDYRVNDTNQGFSSNVNKAVKIARGKYIYLLNTDTKPEPGFLEEPIKLLESNPKVFAGGSAFKYRWSKMVFENGYVNIPQPEEMKKTDKTHISAWVSGGQSLFRKKTWDELGGLDPIYNPFYWEELDLCYRAWKSGYKILWCPQSRVIHQNTKGVIKSHFSEREINFIGERNQLLFIWKNISSPKLKRKHYLGLIKRVLLGPNYFKVIFAALFRYLRFRNKKVVDNPQKSDLEILNLFK